MRKVVLFFYFISALTFQNNLKASQDISSMYDISIEKLKRKLTKASNIAINVNDLKEGLKQNYSEIESDQDKIYISKLLRKLSEANTKKDFLEEDEKTTIKETILKSFSNFTSITAIKCATIITVLFQVQGIITSKDLLNIIKEITSGVKTVSWATGIKAFLKCISTFFGIKNEI
ncbi:hypothetical protein GF385_03575 [Candidatus Dependentiae bacterium]|nr:hypothetical protein [Candidatus Dependentiae bacterium]